MGTGSRWRKRLVRAFAIVVVLLVGYRVAAELLVTRTDRRAPRDPSTGVMLGAEERTLGPASVERTAVFVHGCVGTGNNFNRLPQLLADAGWHVRVLRLPGHGTSPREFETTTIEELLSAVKGEVQRLRDAGARKILLVGHSMGGTLSTITASEMPIDGLILGGAYFGVTHQWFYILKPETWHKLTAPALRWIYKGRTFMLCNRADVKPNIVAYTWVPTNGLTTLQRLGEIANQRVLLSNVNCPVLMLHAPSDHAASFASAKAAFDRFGSKRKKFVELPRSDHHVFWDYDADLVERKALAFAGLLTD